MALLSPTPTLPLLLPFPLRLIGKLPGPGGTQAPGGGPLCAGGTRSFLLRSEKLMAWESTRARSTLRAWRVSARQVRRPHAAAK